ncbi:MAG: hypothetical protein IT330_15025 [Anaerolineae bacterium]|nr:hypothetical protein [Anaerolineae bacterium]
MKRKPLYLLVSLIVSLAVVFLAGPEQTSLSRGQQPAPEQAELNLPEMPAAPIGNGFTYQGLLTANGNRANGTYDLRFALFSAESDGTQVGSTLEKNDVTVVDGLFTVKLDFGGVFGSAARWLEIGVRAGNSIGPYTTLSPRQELTPTPQALALPGVFTDESVHFVGIGRNFRISGNEVFGIRYVGNANQYGGMYVETSDAGGWPFYGYATNGSFRAWTYYNGTTGDWFLYNAGIRLMVPNEGGLRIGPSLNYSLLISNTTAADGIRVLDTGDDAIQIGSNPDIPNYGVYIPSPGVSTYGLWPNTSNALGEWALYTVDDIQAGNVLASALSLVARVNGSQPLNPGDVVAVTGMGEPVPGGQSALPLVALADSKIASGIIGVVKSRMVWELAPGKEEEGAMAMHSAPGAAQAGDYVSLVIYGITEVKVDPDASITVGQRLTAAELPGRVRALRTETLNGMVVTEGAQVVGIALVAPVEGQDTIPVFVTLR